MALDTRTQILRPVNSKSIGKFEIFKNSILEKKSEFDIIFCSFE